MTRWMGPRWIGAWATGALAACALAALPAAAQNTPEAARDAAPRMEPGKLFLNATGEVRAAPDMARVTAGVVAEAATASEAMADQRERMTAVMAALEEAGVAASDIQTTGLDLSPVYASYNRNQDENQGPRITGYRASNRVTVIARDLSLVGPTLDALVEVGANTIDGVSFDIEESDTLLNEARRDAVAKLRDRAELYADAAGLNIGRILEMSESQNYRPVERMEMSRALTADAATPVSGGELTISVTVNATFEITG